MILSIVIPSYNHHRFILKTIQAASAISFSEKEIIVIDDGSTDSSVDVIRKYIDENGSNETIRLIARENRGLVRTLNEGLSVAKGKFFYCVASDDIPVASGIQQLVGILESNDAVQFALGNSLFMSSEEQTEFRLTYGGTHDRFFRLPWKERQREMFLHYPQPILLQSTVFRSSLLRDIGGWTENVMLDDMSLFLRLFSRFTDVGKDFRFCPEIVACYYRQHNANASGNIERQFRMVEQALERFCAPEVLDNSLFRNAAAHMAAALTTGRFSLMSEIGSSTLGRLGFSRLVRAVAAEAWDSIENGSSRNKAKSKPVIQHQSAAAGLGYCADRSK